MPSIITENTDPTPPKYPKSSSSYHNRARIITSKNTKNSPIKPNSSPIETKRNRSHYPYSGNPFSGGKKSRKRRIRKSKKYGKYRKQNKKTFRFF